MPKYVWNLLIALDQLGNAIFGGNPDSTISGRIGRYLKFRPKSLVQAIPWPAWLRKHFLDSIGS